MDKAVPPKTVLETILEWSEQRPAWQRDALRRIVSEGTPDEAAILELVALCKKGKGAKDIDLDAVPLETAHLPVNPGDGNAITLHAITDIVGVNQLARNQRLAFEVGGLTIIYGPNGAGKSGYARILKRACRARQAGEIMPDAFNPLPTGKATASIVIGKAGIEQVPMAWVDSDQHDGVLSAISVFDKDCASVHIQEKNEVAFRPFGLDIPDDLAGACQKVKEKLTVEQTHLNAIRDPIFEKSTWSLVTVVGKILSGLTVDTDIKGLEKLGEVTGQERARHKQLTEDLLMEPVEAAAQRRLFADNIKKLLTTLERTAINFSDEALNVLKNLADTARAKREAAELAAEKAFGGLAIQGVGAESWRALWEAARHYSEHAAYPGRPFPPGGDEACVLCHQPLSADARTRLESFEAFIKQDTEKQADDAEKAFQETFKEFKSRTIDVRVLAQTRQRIAIQNAALGKSILRFLASADLRRLKCLAALNTTDALLLSAFASFPKEYLEEFEAEVRAYAKQLDDAADIEGRERLKRERDELTDRIAVPDLLETARKEVDRLKHLKLLRDCLAETATNAITKLGNDIADHVITPRMRDQFQSEIVQLAADKVRVEVVRSGGQFGSPQYEIRFFANPKVKVHNVLSEGEQTCVALAAFLTELATANHKSALVFDDPVSSLDHRWRQKVAERLVAEAGQRQIIVFTHDLIFVNDLHDMAVRKGVQVKLVTLSRGLSGTGIVSDGLPWRHSGVKDRIDKLEKTARASKYLYEKNDEEGYRNVALPIYSELRATWERGLEDIVFAGVIHRHRDYIDTKNLKKVVALEEADVLTFESGFKKCSNLIEAHDSSRGRDADVPPPDEILQDIQTMSTWAASLRDRQKALN